MINFAAHHSGEGIGSLVAARLLLRLLHWLPNQRPTAAVALNHAFFTGIPDDPEPSCAPYGQVGWC